MVARRAAGDEGIVGLAGHHVVDCRDCPADCGQGHLQALLRGVGIGFELVDLPLFLGDLPHHRKEMLLGMCECHQILVRLLGLDPLEAGEVGMLQRNIERAQPVGPFWVALGCIVFEEDRVLPSPLARQAEAGTDRDLVKPAAMPLDAANTERNRGRAWTRWNVWR